MDRFSQGWMRMYRVREIIQSGLETNAQRRLMDEIASVRADDVHAQKLTVLRFRNNLDHAFCVAVGHGSAAGLERECAHAHVITGISRGDLAETHRGDL